MRQSFIRFQLVFVSLVLLGTFALTMAMVIRHNRRWDLTRERIYSLSETTLELLNQMRSGPVEVLAFYPHDDPTRNDFEIFLKECRLRHSDFQYHFYDPDRSPQVAKKWRVKTLHTVIVRYNHREERLIRPNEEMFATALLRLVNPKVTTLCFVTGHGETGLWGEERNGLKLFREALEENNYAIQEIFLARDKVPASCQVVAVTGPQRDWNAEEIHLLKNAFQEGRSIFFLIDPVDPGTGKSFEDFAKDFGIRLGGDVIVDKMSRMVGGDFLVPFVNQYATEHPVTAQFDMATFFPVARSVQPTSKVPEGIEVFPLAFSGSGSWAETNLEILEKGEAAFETETDFPGPLSLVVAVEAKKDDKGGRMVILGDSDFITNAYLDLAGNKDFALKAIQWLAKDDRAVSFRQPPPKFQPLFLDIRQRLVLLVTALLVYPVFFLIVGTIWIFWRRRMM